MAALCWCLHASHFSSSSVSTESVLVDTAFDHVRRSSIADDLCSFIPFVFFFCDLLCLVSQNLSEPIEIKIKHLQNKHGCVDISTQIFSHSFLFSDSFLSFFFGPCVRIIRDAAFFTMEQRILLIQQPLEGTTASLLGWCFSKVQQPQSVSEARLASGLRR